MAKNLPTTTGNVVADVGKAVANEIGTAMFNYLTEDSKQKTARTAIREETKRYIADVEGETQRIATDLKETYNNRGSTLAGYFDQLDKALADKDLGRYNLLLGKIADLSTRSALADYEIQKQKGSNSGHEKEVYDA